jgi:hypothetical protein
MHVEHDFKILLIHRRIQKDNPNLIQRCICKVIFPNMPIDNAGHYKYRFTFASVSWIDPVVSLEYHNDRDNHPRIYISPLCPILFSIGHSGYNDLN